MLDLRRLVSAVVGLLVFTLTAVSHAQSPTPLTVYAAASLGPVFEAIAADFEAAHPEIDVIFNFAASSQLVAQISEGAPADVFASADQRQMTAAVTTGRIDAAAPVVFARNRLAIVTPADNPAALAHIRDLANPGLRFVLAAPGVPVRGYADSTLSRLATVYGRDWLDAVYGNLASEEENVRQTLVRVALGEADAGIVYVTDALTENVALIPVPALVNPLVTYPIAVLNDTPHTEAAALWIAQLLSDAGQSALMAAGFLPAR